MLKPMFVTLALALSAFSFQQATQTSAPEKSAAPASQSSTGTTAQMVNPVKPTPASQAHAKKLYGYDCAMCHGANGDGKGDVGADMKPAPGDFTNPATLKNMTDSDIYNIIKNGKGAMPAEGDRAKPDDVWNMVILIRSYAKS